MDKKEQGRSLTEMMEEALRPRMIIANIVAQEQERLSLSHVGAPGEMTAVAIIAALEGEGFEIRNGANS